MRSTGDVHELIGLPAETIAGRNILIVEDIVDTGNTLQHLRDDLTARGARRVIIATMLLKNDVFRDRFPLDYVGFDIPSAFVVGYGLDYNGYGRTLDGIYQLKPA